MIQDFFNTIQQDFIHLGEYVKKDTHTDDENQRAGRAAARIFATGGMAVAGVLGVSAFFAATPGGAIFKLAAAVAIYAVSHDVFVMAVNSDKGVVDQAVALGKGIVADVVDWFKGKKDLDDAPRHPLTEGTFFRPIWDAVIARG